MDDGLFERREHGQHCNEQTVRSQHIEPSVSSCEQHQTGILTVYYWVITSHVAGPLVAFKVELTPGLSNVLCGLLLLHLPELLLGIFTQEVNSWRKRS